MEAAAPRLGHDLVDVERFRRALARRGTGFRRRVFTATEWAVSEAEDDPARALAARFAAKEAAFKALGSGWGRGVGWREVEVPAEGTTLVLTGRAAALAEAAGVTLTVSHAATREAAVALVIAQ